MALATAQLTNYRQSPRKVRLVVDLIRGKNAEHALALLSTLPKRASDPVAKLLKSAISNSKIDAHDLYVSAAQVNGGIVFKRSMPRARGRASQILKRTSHVTLAVDQAAPKKAKAKLGKEKAESK